MAATPPGVGGKRETGVGWRPAQAGREALRVVPDRGVNGRDTGAVSNNNPTWRCYWLTGGCINETVWVERRTFGADPSLTKGYRKVERICQDGICGRDTGVDVPGSYSGRHRHGPDPG
jgi:hypothetical protein